MYQKYYIILFILLWGGQVFAQTGVSDVAAQIRLEEVVVSSTKETNELKTLPGSLSFITPRMMADRKIMSIVDLSTAIPNFFIPAYGSKMSPPVYIRGIGERSTGQAIGLYVDNMPYLDKSVFNFDFLDVQRIEVLRGPQGTLYGRNAMSGIVNIFTHSPLDEERSKVTLTAGNYGLFRTSATVSQKLGQRAGVSLSGYYNGNNGFFKNQYDGKQADRLRSAGGRFRLDMKPAEKWNIRLMAGYDYSDQGAFPYGIYQEDGDVAQPDYNSPGSYTREVLNSNINLEFRTERFIVTSSTAFQHFDDDMNMDVDYRPQTYFFLNQKQKETNWTQEFAVKSNSRRNYRWSVGAFAFSRNLRTDVLTTMGKAGIDSTMQYHLDQATKDNPRAPKLVVTNQEIQIPGTFKTPAYGAAFFHQSTYNNLGIDGLSITAGIRVDYEKTTLDYNTSTSANVDAVMGGRVIGTVMSGTTLIGSGSMSFTEWLPKAAIKYEFDDRRYLYFSAAKGYKAGGYNIQMFADIVQALVQDKRDTEPIPAEAPDSILARTSYKPEYSWNYEIGFKGELVEDKLVAEAAIFYVDVQDVQVTQFVQSGQGRLLKNAGRAGSYGLDLSLTARLTEGLTLSATYGYTHATLKNYHVDTVDYSGKYIPFAPQNTFSLGAGYSHTFGNRRILDRFHIHAQYNGAGKIYWNEANTDDQDFYGLLNLKAGVSKGVFSLNIWTRNTLNTDYAAFGFRSASFQPKSGTPPIRMAQKGTPFQIGVDLTVLF